MALQTISLILNVLLLIALVVVVLKANARLMEEKLATFAGALNAFLFGLAAVDPEKRWHRLSVGLNGMLGDEVEEIQWRLIRASMMRFLRAEPVAADLGEHLHALMLESIRGEDEAERVWGYIDGAIAKEAGFEQEPSQRFTGAVLAKGQFQLEGALYRMYAAKLAGHPPKVFG